MSFPSSSFSPTTSSSAHAAQVRVLTELDHVRLGKWLQAPSAAADALQDVLDSAELVPSAQVAPDVVTMRSRLRVAESGVSDAREIALVYPDEADAGQGRISVLSPVGTALLGLRAGQQARWCAPDGRAAVLQVEAITFQPEASGELLR